MRKTAFALLFFAIAAGLYAQTAVVTLRVYDTRTNFSITPARYDSVRTSAERLASAFQKQQTGQFRLCKYPSDAGCADFASYVQVTQAIHTAGRKYKVAMQIIDARTGGIVYKRTLETGNLRRVNQVVDRIVRLMGPVNEKLRRYEDEMNDHSADNATSGSAWIACLNDRGMDVTKLCL
ncbi:MAG: hypothetical protein JST19_19885 [Bacteroidetes bacterium]|nr:hypothetical protein [Bacteroidota bacterium]